MQLPDHFSIQLNTIGVFIVQRISEIRVYTELEANAYFYLMVLCWAQVIIPIFSYWRSVGRSLNHFGPDLDPAFMKTYRSGLLKVLRIPFILVVISTGAWVFL